MNKYLYFCFLIFFSNKIIICSNTTCFEYSCGECESPEYGKCTKCREGFRLIDGTCPCSDTSCALCYSGLAGLHLCALCKKGYYNFNQDCYCDIEDCEICSEKGCIKCKTGYFYNKNTNSCEEQKEEDKISCFDQNCDACYSEEKGGCDYCKEGYDFVKGECEKLPDVQENNKCPDGYYLEEEKCEKICSGVDCSNKQFYYYICPSNECLVCTNNVLQIFSECDNSKICAMDGCLNCITNEECLICSQGYYLLYGKCIKCTEGCSICPNNNTCIYCLSGYELNSEKKCIKTENFDFNLDKYKKYKKQLIEINFPDETTEDINLDSEITECDSNCLKCYDDNGECKECNKLYILENNKCIKHCSDSNCIECSLVNENEQCTKCNDSYVVKNGKCNYKCSDVNCLSCTLEDNLEICSKCSSGYQLDDSQQICKAKMNYITIIFGIIIVLLIIITIISFIIYKKQKKNYRRQMISMRYNDQSNNVNVYGRNRIDNSYRMEFNKEEISDEYEVQKRKMEKGYQMCQFCKKRPGKFMCECGCIVCKEHSNLKEMEGDGEKYKVCFACQKIVKKVSQMKYDCHICMQKKSSVAHFKCGCALEVCKDCYIKCKMSSNKCPGCRAEI